MSTSAPRVLCIAGADSSGGAGIAADQRAVERLGGRAFCTITAVTAQSHKRVATVHAVPPTVLRAQLDVLQDAAPVDAIKVGMLASGALLTEVLAWMHTLPSNVPVVVDPVLISSSGAHLLDDAGIEALPKLFRRTTVLTPNAAEARFLAGSQTVEAWANTLPCAVLVTGGDEPSPDTVTDWLYLRTQAPIPLQAPRFPGASPRGTGCTLASALATLLAQGHSIPTASRLAGDYVRTALMA